MAIDSKRLPAVIDEITRVIISNIPKYTSIAAKEMEGLIKKRVFNNSKATDGGSLGKYRSKSYAKKRQKAGRQISRKDLEFTSGLRNALQTKFDKGGYEANLTFVGRTRKGLEYGKLAEYQEDRRQVGKIIFSANNSEVKDITDTFFFYVNADIERVLSKY